MDAEQVPDSAANEFLALTKFVPPRLRTDCLMRPDLVAELHRALQSNALTLISAPAGYGKTSLLALCLKTNPQLRSAWISLDEDDNEPVRFLYGLIAGLQMLSPAVGSKSKTLIAHHQSTGMSLRAVVSVLINEILECLPDDFILVLDDLHIITDPGVYAILDHLLERLPAQMHIAAGHVLTRRLRWPGGGRVASWPSCASPICVSRRLKPPIS